MTVTSVGSSNARFDAWEDVDGGFSPTSVSGEVAVLLLETEENQKQLSREMLDAARRDFAEALAEQVGAMRDAADAKFSGAFLQAIVSFSGSIAGMVSLETGERSYPAVLSNGLDKLAAPLGTMRSHTYADADAVQAEGAQKVAQWRIEDARDDIHDSDGLQDKALDWLASIVEQDVATVNAVLANKV